MDKTFDALFDLNECAVGHDVDDSAFDGGTDRVLGFDFVPRILGLLLETEGDALLVVVDVEDHHFDFLSEFEHFVRMGDASPGHIGDVEETVNTAEVDERTEVGDVFHDAFADLVDFHIFKQLGAAILAGCFEKFAAGNNDVSAVLIDLEDLEFVFLADEIVHVFDRTDVDLGAGEERLYAVQVDDDTAFDTVFHQTGDHTAFTVFAGDLVPGLDEVCLLEADAGHAVLVFDFFEINIHLVTDFDICPVAEFDCRNESFRFVADVHECAVVSLFDDFSGDDGILDEFALLLIGEQSVHGDVVCAEIDVALDLFRCSCCCCAHFFLVFLLVCLRILPFDAFAPIAQIHIKNIIYPAKREKSSSSIEKPCNNCILSVGISITERTEPCRQKRFRFWRRRRRKRLKQSNRDGSGNFSSISGTIIRMI